MSNFILLIFINILAIIVTHFVTKKRDQWKFTQEIKQRHLNEIKVQVFQPILNVLDNRWLPILERKRVNLQIVQEEKKSHENTVTPTLVSIKHTLGIWEEPIDLKSINRQLYKDTIDNHYALILRRYESFILDADKHVKGCISYANEIKIKILQMTNLPEYNPMPPRRIYEEEWIKSNHLAIFIVRKQIVPNDKNLSLNPIENSWQPSLKVIMSNSDQIGECAVCSKPEKIIEILNEILMNKEKVYELIIHADKLKEECFEIKNDMEKLCLSKKLIGDCVYIRF